MKKNKLQIKRYHAWFPEQMYRDMEVYTAKNAMSIATLIREAIKKFIK